MFNTVYDNIIIGGTYSGFGFMMSSGENNLWVSQNVYLEDYSPAFKFEKVSCNSEAGEKLLKEFEHGGLVDKGYLNIAEAAINLYKQAQDKNFNIMYKTLIRTINKANGIYELECVNSWGTFDLRAKNIINTTPMFNEITEKYFNVLCDGNKKFEGEDYAVKDTYFRDMKILKINVDCKSTFADARIKFFELMHKPNLKGLRAVLSPSEFEFKCIEKPQIFEQIVSCNFSNLIESYEKGWERGLK